MTQNEELLDYIRRIDAALEGDSGDAEADLLGEIRSAMCEWLMQAGINPDAPPVPLGMQRRPGVDVGCGSPDCGDCYRRVS